MSELTTTTTEELEPLFDYRRVQPPPTFDDDDDDDSSSPSRSKRVKLSSDKVKKVNKDQKEIVHILDNEDKDEEEEEELDWLPPPPKMRCDSKMIEEDETIKKLRLQKQQLESFAKSAKDVIRAVEEDLAKTTHHVTTTDERQKIVISIQDDKGERKQFRVYKDDKFEKLFKMYGDKNKIEMTSLVFTFDGDKINPMITPDSLGMEDDDIVEVHHTKNK